MCQVMDVRCPVFLKVGPQNVSVSFDKWVAVIADKYVAVTSDQYVVVTSDDRRLKSPRGNFY